VLGSVWPPPWPNLGEGTNLRKITVRRAEPRAGRYKDGTCRDVRKRDMGFGGSDAITLW
jgi:hypothetical protein